LINKIIILDGIFLLFYCFIFALFFRGFFYPDPLFANQFPLLRTAILLIVRIGVFALALFILFLYYNIRTKKLKLNEFGLLFIAMLCVFVLFYLISGHFYLSSITKPDVANFHPYLQLAPNKFTPDEYPDNKHISIMCLGGSTTEYKDSNGLGWPKRVETSLRRSLNRNDISVHNQGRQWYTTLHTLINYEANLRHYKPDIIIVMHTINDLLHNADFSSFSKADFQDDYGHFYGPIKEVINPPKFHSYIWDKFKYLWYHEKRKIITTNTFTGIVPFKRHINTLIDLAKKDSAAVILMTQPSLYKKDNDKEILPHLKMLNTEAFGKKAKWSYESALNGFMQYNLLIKQISDERNVYLIDLERKIPKTLKYFIDDVHYTDASFDLVAKAVTDGIIKAGIVTE
jgi:hypothetical protein